MIKKDPTNNGPVGLVCHSCGNEYGPGTVWRCECGHALDFSEVPIPDGVRPDFSDLITKKGLWAFDEFIPIKRSASFGEGFTPLLDVPELGAQCKLEYVLPTGSFKDRGATTIVSRAVELGVDTLVDDSSGNAGSAIATYAAPTNIATKIFVSKDVKPKKRETIEKVGAEVIAVPGTRDEVTETCINFINDTNAWYASHAWSPAFYEGTMTVAFELAVQRDWDVPDAIVSPLGHGTLFLGLYRGFDRLRRAGWINEVPRLYGVQASGYAPIAEHYGESLAKQNNIADGIEIEKPARFDQIVDAVNDTDGGVVAVSKADIEPALERLHTNGFYVEPTCSVVLAGLERFRENGEIALDSDVVLPLTGSGLKTT